MKFHGLFSKHIQGFIPRYEAGSPPVLPDAFLKQDGTSYFLLQNGVDRMIKQ